MKVSQSCLFQGSSSVFINRRFSSTVRPVPPKLHVTSTDRMLKRKPLDETLRSGLGKSDIRPFDGTGLMVSPEPKKNSKPLGASCRRTTGGNNWICCHPHCVK